MVRFGAGILVVDPPPGGWVSVDETPRGHSDRTALRRTDVRVRRGLDCEW